MTIVPGSFSWTRKHFSIPHSFLSTSKGKGKVGGKKPPKEPTK